MPLALLAALALSGDQVPDWIRIVPAGEFRARDGRGPWRVRDAEAVITASLKAAPLPIDENHATDRAAKEGGAAPARGWITELQARDDGLHARVEWTPSGRALLTDRAYRAVSPVIEHTKDGDVLRVLRVALTNDPAVPDLSLLTAEEPTSVDLKALRAALGLPETADETAILTAATAAGQAQRDLTATLTRIAGAAGLAADAKPDAIVSALTTRAAAGDPAQLAQTVATLETRLATLTQATAKERAERAVDQAIRDGKPISALRDHYIARHMADPAAVTAELTALPSINAGGIVTPPKTEGAAGGLSAEEAKVVALLGIDPTAYEAERKRLGLKQEAV